MFQQRSTATELLDEKGIPFADIKQNMQELDVINKLLGGHRTTLKGLSLLLRKANRQQTISIAEIGCGDGNNLRVIKRWADKNNFDVALHGIDYNQACIDYATELEANKHIGFTCSDYRAVRFAANPDIIFSSLFCHHFSNAALMEQLQWMHQHARIGFFINDLHRHPFAYHSIKVLTTLFSKSYLVKHDAPLSVLRGFSKKDWLHLLNKAALQHAQCSWEWAFRWLIVSSRL